MPTSNAYQLAITKERGTASRIIGSVEFVCGRRSVYGLRTIVLLAARKARRVACAHATDANDAANSVFSAVFPALAKIYGRGSRLPAGSHPQNRARAAAEGLDGLERLFARAVRHFLRHTFNSSSKAIVKNFTELQQRSGKLREESRYQGGGYAAGAVLVQSSSNGSTPRDGPLERP